MRHNRPSETRTTRRVPKTGGQCGPVSSPPSDDRRSRLERWASLLERDPHRLVALLRPSWAAGDDIAPMTASPSAIDLAWADPVFRVTGFAGRSRGDAIGRESCRDRVWWIVESSGVAWAIKK